MFYTLQWSRSPFNRNNPPRYRLDLAPGWQEEDLAAPGSGHGRSEVVGEYLQGHREEIISQWWDKVYKRRNSLLAPCSTYLAVKKSSLFFSLLVIKSPASCSKSWAQEGSGCVL